MRLDGNVLVTGTDSGLGKYCSEYFQATCFSRRSTFIDLMTQAQKKPFDVIIHCAFNAKPEVNSAELYAYLNDTTLLTQKLLQIPHQRFIFISSTDVYPKNETAYTEDNPINLSEVANIYGISKLLSESLVLSEGKNPLILRTTALLGLDARKNSLIKILTQENVNLTLAAASTFNYILHADVSSFIETAWQLNLTGIYNLAAASNVALGDVNAHYQRQVQFGSYHYYTGLIDNTKAKTVLDNFNKTSWDNIQQFSKLLSIESL